jgi:hypothetical protein
VFVLKRETGKPIKNKIALGFLQTSEQDKKKSFDISVAKSKKRNKSGRLDWSYCKKQ